MKKKLTFTAAALLALILSAVAIVYSVFAVATVIKTKTGGKDLELVTGLPGMRDTAIATLGSNSDEFPAGSHVTATLRVQYCDGDRYFWADEVKGGLDVDGSGKTEKLVLSKRQRNIVYTEVEITVVTADGTTETQTLTETRSS